MKKLLLTPLTVLFFISNQTIGQINEYFDHNPVWQIYSSCAVPLPCLQNEDFNYYLNGDTVINSLTYKKLYRKGLGSFSWMGPPPVGAGCSGTYSYINPDPECFVRSANKQIYIYELANNSEYLLYDFDLAVGDTLPLTFNNYEPSIVVTAIDSFLTPYGYRKIFAVAGNTWITELVEGVGHDLGFLEPVHIPFECGYTLTCFSLNDTSYYPSPGLTCNLNVGISEQAGIISELRVSPNPFVEFAEFSWPELYKEVDFSLFNILGEKVRHEPDINDSQYLLNSSGLSPGLYIYKLDSPGALIGSGKVVVAE